MALTLRVLRTLVLILPAASAAAAPLAVSVDFNAAVRPVSPLIFGVSFGDPARNAAVGYPLVRWGGNATTRYNWQTDFSNHASDYYFENIPNCTAPTCTGTPPAGNSADAFVAAALTRGAQPLMTVTTIGWTPRADSPPDHPFFAGFSVKKYGVQEPTAYLPATDPYDPDAGTGECLPANNPSPDCVAYGNAGGYHLVNNDPADTSTAITPDFEQQWLAHLQATFGAAAAGGVKLYALDNEIMLWNSTHRDVHPDPTTYDEAWSTAAAYATALKQQDPGALVTGPVTWGYCDLFGSALDNCVLGSDRTAHGGLAFVAWYLQQVCANPLPGGKRLIDYLDLHYYPAGTNVALSDVDDATTAARRLAALKELYDPTWVADSWIADLGDTDANHYDKPALIPRVRAWIDQYCPGTKLAITEYNWGEDGATQGSVTQSSSGVAQAEALAIFAREGVDLAARWVAPDPDTRVEDAFRLFLNYDGAGAAVRGDSTQAASASVDLVGAYAFRDYGHHHYVLLTNKGTSSQSVTVTFAASQSGAWSWYEFDGTHALRALAGGSNPGTSLPLALPPMSANLIVLPDNDALFRDGFD